MCSRKCAKKSVWFSQIIICSKKSHSIWIVAAAVAGLWELFWTLYSNYKFIEFTAL